MKLLAFALVIGSVAASAQDLSLSVLGTSGNGVFTSPYQMPDTPVGSGNTVVLRLKDATTQPIDVLAIAVSTTPGGTVQNPNFTLTGTFAGKTLSPNGSNFEDFTVAFAPTVQGALSGDLTVFYEIQANGCVLGGSDASTACPPIAYNAGTLQGNALPQALILSYAAVNGQNTLQPFASSPLSFGNISLSSSNPIVFTLTNDSNATLAVPPVSIIGPVFASEAFAVDTSNLPASLAPGAAANFTVTFAPGQIGLTTATLAVGTLTFPIAGNGVVVSSIDALQITCVDSNGIRTSPQSATPIAFGPVVAGTNETYALTFTVTNPSTSLNPISIPSLSVTGNGFVASNLPTMPMSLAPGQSFTFVITFAPTANGTYGGTLAIGTRTYTLSGRATASQFAATMQVDTQPLQSNQQPHLSINVSQAPTADLVGELSMTFTPYAEGVNDDPSILFVSGNTRKIQVTVPAGSQDANANGQQAITFQTGTTAGTITFTLTFPNSAPVTQSFNIVPQTVQITSASAVRQQAQLVLTISGFDNTHSAGKLSFTFMNSNGAVINSTPMSVDATTQFAQYFASSAAQGGAFAMQATFPVTGDTAQVASVSVQVGNSAGDQTASETFQ